MSRHFPLFADLNNRPVLLVGAGHVAARKAEDLLRAGARLRVVARELSPVFQDWLAAGRITYLGAHFHRRRPTASFSSSPPPAIAS